MVFAMRVLALFCFIGLMFVPGFAGAQSPFPSTNPWYEGRENFARNHLNLQNLNKSEQQDNRAYRYRGEQEPSTVAEMFEQAGVDVVGDDQDEPRVLSALERSYAGRIVDELEQFGYDVFGAGAVGAVQALPAMGAVQDDFVLGVGDELDITFTGQRSDQTVYKIDSSGRVLIKDFAPIPAAGRTIADVKLSVQAAADQLYNTKAYVSLGSVRQIGVLIVGHVERPGRQMLSAFHSVLDALAQAGGIEKTGSLRQVKLVRNGRSSIIDLYGVLMHGSLGNDLRLMDGDRIIVPSIGPTVAVGGEVKRPGIYEIPQVITGRFASGAADSARKVSLGEMLDLAGGILSPGKNRFLKMAVGNLGQEDVGEVEDMRVRQFGNGAILMVSKGENKRVGTVELEGQTRRPGIHALSENRTLSSLISSSDILGSDIYPLLGVIERWNEVQLAREHIGFPLKLVLDGEYDRQLQDGDVVHLFSNEQIESLNSEDTPDLVSTRLEVGSFNPEEEDGRIIDEVLHSFVSERVAFVRGAVRKPGAYPVSDGVTLDNLLAVAGGLALEANTGNIEITSSLQGEGHQSDGRSGTRRLTLNLREIAAQDVPIGFGDSVRVNQKFKKTTDKTIYVGGEVMNPGAYDLMAGDKVSDLIARAGGLTAQAYADGAIFSRASERRAEEARFRAQARMMRQAVAAALEKSEKDVNAGQIAEARALAEELENVQGVGRITVTAAPDMLAVKPELDMLLEAGDRLHIPKRSLSVRVSGEVLSAAALQFRDDKKPLDYIHEAGGFTFHADKDRAFVLYPDGSAQPLQVSSWNYNPIFIPPGSTVVVPRDPKPFDFIESAKDVSQILSNLAITAIFVDDVRD